MFKNKADMHLTCVAFYSHQTFRSWNLDGHQSLSLRLFLGEIWNAWKENEAKLFAWLKAYELWVLEDSSGIFYYHYYILVTDGLFVFTVWWYPLHLLDTRDLLR